MPPRERYLPLLVLIASLLPGVSVLTAVGEVHAQSGDADPAAIQRLPRDDSGSAVCGAIQVDWSNTRSLDPATPGSVSLRATADDGTLLVDLSRELAPGERLIPLWCGDVVGDGSQVLGLETFSGGAHCCFSVSVVALEPSARHLLDVDLGNGGLAAPEQIDGSGSLELPGGSDVFAYFDDLSFAASPFMPLVFAYDGQRYVEATRQFPDRLAAQVDQADADLAEAVARPAPPGQPPRLMFQEQESVALRLYGLHVLLGDADAALPGIQGQVAPPVAEWLAANAPAAADAIAHVYN